ncbi:ATP synthase F1 subunit delta [Buchnera aphidicola]|uniref:ATP synthase F1 subunit delta n=1 Tax=Buchnera aphidicola TaxID=9 RepID=UPI0030ECA810
MLKKKISCIYAKIIFKLSKKKNKILEWEKKLKIFSFLIKKKKLKPIFLGLFGIKESYKFFISLCHFNLNKYEKKFIKSLSHLKKIYLMKYILKEYITLKNKYYKNIKIKLISSVKLNSKQKNKIEKYFKKKFNKNKILINYFIDVSLIKGIVLKINSLIIDLSIKNKLNCLFNNLIK